MEINPANAFRIYGLPIGQLKTYLPRVFAKLAVPAEGDGIVVETYVGQLHQIFMRRGEEGEEGTGWSQFQTVCVECGVFETLLSLVQHPRDDIETAIHCAWDSISWLSFMGNAAQRKILRDKATACNALNICLRCTRNGELCLHRYGASRLLRSLCVEMQIGSTMNALQTGELLEALFRHISEEANSFSDELADPDKGWQVELMTDRFTPQPGAARRYGFRWFCLVQEYCLFSAHALLCCLPPRSAQFRLDILKSSPIIIDLALDCATWPRQEWYPETQMDQLALEVCLMLVHLPLRSVSGLPIPQDALVRNEYDDEWQTSLSILDIFTSRPGMVEKMINGWERLDNESYSEIQRSLVRVKSEWFGMQLSMDQIGDIFEMRGYSRVSLIQLIIAATYSPSCQESDLISLLHLVYLSTKRNTPLAADEFVPCGDPRTFAQESSEWHERMVCIFRPPNDLPCATVDNSDAPLQAPAASVGAPNALLRIFTVLAERGILEKIPTWRTLPVGCISGTNIQHIQQITSTAVIKKLLPLVAKRVAAHRDKTRKVVAEGCIFEARIRYRQAAELAASLIAFDSATEGQWTESIRGMHKELVLSLGNAAEMSNRHAEYKTALGFAEAANEVARAAPHAEGISADTVAKNARRAETARAHLATEP